MGARRPTGEGGAMRQFMALRDFVFGQVGVGCAIPLSVRRQTVAKAPSPFDVPAWALDELSRPRSAQPTSSVSPRDRALNLAVMRFYDSVKIPEEGTAGIRLFERHNGDRSRTNMVRPGMLGGCVVSAVITGWRAVTIPDKSESVNNIGLRIVINSRCHDDVLARFVVDGAPTFIHVPDHSSFTVEVNVYRSYEVEPVMLFVVIEGWARREVE